jgi:hypothetical protein
LSNGAAAALCIARLPPAGVGPGGTARFANEPTLGGFADEGGCRRGKKDSESRKRERTKLERPVVGGHRAGNNGKGPAFLRSVGKFGKKSKSSATTTRPDDIPYEASSRFRLDGPPRTRAISKLRGDGD